MYRGGDIYEMAGTIFESAEDTSRLKGATVNVTGITNASPGVVTTGITHRLADGQVVNIFGMDGITRTNNVPLNTTVLTSYTFSIGVDISASGSWTGGGEVTPNARNSTVTINNWPDNYLILSVIPLQQNVTIKFEWESEGVNYLTDATVLTLVSASVTQYMNGIHVDKPLNISNPKDTFLQFVNATIDMGLISKLNVIITANGIVINPDPNTSIISGDPFSYFYTAPDSVTVDGV